MGRAANTYRLTARIALLAAGNPEATPRGVKMGLERAPALSDRA